MGPLLIILAFLILIVGGVAIRQNKWPGLPWSLGLAPTNFTLISEAKSGEVVRGFPTEFLALVEDAKIQKSASYTLASDKTKSEVLTTTYTTKAPVADLFAAYLQHFNDSGFIVLKTGVVSGFSSLEVANSTSNVSVSISVYRMAGSEVRIDVRAPQVSGLNP
ncbi:MAG: hypothetical protein AAB660_01840 [Patescibacteria group bacterium]